MINRNVFADASFVLYPGSSFYWSWTTKINIDYLAGLWLLMKVLEKLLRIIPGTTVMEEVGKALKWIDGEFGKAVEFDG